MSPEEAHVKVADLMEQIDADMDGVRYFTYSLHGTFFKLTMFDCESAPHLMAT